MTFSSIPKQLTFYHVMIFWLVEPVSKKQWTAARIKRPRCLVSGKNKAPLSPLNQYVIIDYQSILTGLCGKTLQIKNCLKQSFIPKYITRSSYYHAFYQYRSIYYAFSTLPLHLPNSLYLHVFTLSAKIASLNNLHIQ